MKKLILLFTSLLALSSSLTAQVAVKYTGSTGRRSEPTAYKIATGQSDTYEVGSTLTISGVIGGTPTGGTLNLSALTLTLPTSYTWAGTLSVANGGTGRATSTTAYGLLAAGTTATGAHQTLAAGATTEILVGGGASALPVWTTATGTGAPVRAASPTFTGTVAAASISLTGSLTITTADGTAAGLTAAQTSQRTWFTGMVASSPSFVIRDVNLGSNRLAINTSGDATFNSTTASTSTTTGSGIFGGGIGVAGAINAGGASAITYSGSSPVLTLTANNGGSGRNVLQVTNLDTSTGANATITVTSGTVAGAVQAYNTTYATALYANSFTLGIGTTNGKAIISSSGTGGHIIFNQGAFANEIARFAPTSNNLLLGTTTDSSNGRLQLATHTTAAGGIGLGTDVTLYRSAAGTLSIVGNLTLNLSQSSGAGAINTTYNAGTYGAGTQTPSTLAATGAGDSGGTSSIRPWTFAGTLSGANSASAAEALRVESYNTASAGTLSNMFALQTNVRLAGAGSTSTVSIIQATPVFSSTGNVTSTLTYFNAASPSVSSTGDVTGAINGLFIANIGRSSATTVAAVSVADQTKGSGNALGYRGQVASGSGKYNLFMDGTAQNYLAGVTGIGTAAVSTSNLTLGASTTSVSSLNIPHGSAPSAPVNGDIWTTTSGVFARVNGSTVQLN